MAPSLSRFGAVAKMPFLPLVLAFSMGILAGRAADFPSLWIAPLFSAVLVFVLAIFLKNRSQGNLSLALLLILFFLMGLFRLAVWKEQHLFKPFLAHLPIMADTLKGEIRSVEQTSRMQAVLALREMVRDSLHVKISGEILLYFPYQYPRKIAPGQLLTLQQARIEPLPERRNPGQFDYGEFLRWRGISAICRLSDSLHVEVQPAPVAGFSAENHLFYPLRQQLIGRLEAHFPPPAAGFLKALLLGVREDLGRETVENFQKAGVMHVLAISGLHVGFVALIFYLLLSFLPLYFKQRNLVIIVLLVMYMFLTGAQPAVARATLMATFYLIAINLERRGAVLNYLFAAGLIILLFQPQQLFWIGFQFSFAAVLALAYFYPKLQAQADRLLEYLENEKWRHRLNRWLIAPFLVSLAAQLGAIPLTMHYFHKFSPVSFLLNLPVIPYIGILVAGGFWCLLVSFLNPVLADLFANLLSLKIAILIQLVSRAASLPGAYFNISTFDTLNILIYLSLLLLLFHFKNASLRKIFATACTVFVVIWGTIHLFKTPYFNLLLLDVGQGDATLITTPQGQVLLIDAGPAGEYGSAADAALIPALQYLNKQRVHKLFISHPHLDHLGGTFRLLEYAKVDSVYLPPPLPLADLWNDSLLKVLKRFRVPHRFLNLGERVVVDEETRAYVLGPFSEALETGDSNSMNLNNYSLALLLNHRGHTLLFPGDSEREAESYLQLWQNLLKSDFMKVGHHGSLTSTTEDFLALVSPEYAGISAGVGNKFGHPSPQVLKRLAAYGSKIYRTDREKAIWLRLKKGKWERVAWE